MYFLLLFVCGCLNLRPCSCWQAFYHLSHDPSPFCLGYFSERVLLYAWAIILLVNTSHVAGMIGMHHLAQLFIG
jgi:hypothetical protein